MADVQGLVNELATSLRKRKVEGSRETARLTAELLRTVISAQKLPSPTNQAAALIAAVRGVGQRLIAANPVELAIGNIVRRIFHIIREEELSLQVEGEVVLTLGQSRTVKKFLCAAKKKRSFQVFVAEGAPKYLGHVLAKALAAKGLQTTMITDSSVFAMISRVNVVIVGVHAMMANGGIIAPVGTNMVALAAKKHAVPFVVVAGTHKLCPLYPNNPEVLLNDMRCPSELLSFGEFSDFVDFSIGSGASLLNIVNPAFDYVPPELVSLFVTEINSITKHALACSPLDNFSCPITAG
ncbi:hypothetical protein C1H46_004817 [Malus baccata]|uniref:Translation initiation factor eIF2B subunit beta n=1 Tax=Malus baccata TaxID=106549 RepID=A0A540NF05_MALBA|nr:hypothetical protein C1H46_004817 [Malus baccata]